MDTPPTFANSIGLIITFVVIAGIFIAVILAAVSQRREQEHREETLFRLGYTPVTPAPQQLVDRIAGLRRPGSQKVELQRAFRRPIAGGEIYVFDLVDAGGDETSSIADGAVAIVSPVLDLPRFTIVPHFDFGGRASGMLMQLAERAISWAAARSGLEEISFEGDLEFNAAFITLAEDPEATTAFLTGQRRTELLQMERRYVIDAEGNTLMMSRNPTDREVETAAADRLFEVQQDAERVLGWLRTGAIRYA